MEELTFDRISIPTDWGSRTYVLTREIVDQWIETIGDRNPIYLDDRAAEAAGYPAAVVPPGAWPLFVLDAVQNSVPGRPPGLVHARQELDFGAPACVGDVLTTTMRMVEKYVKRERRYVIQETVTTNQRGETVLVGRMTSIWPR